MRIAFALAGLGGFNAHGAGFLAAATKWGVTPQLVTATSGQIMVLADWLAGRDVRTHLILAGRASGPYDQVRAILFGHPGVFRPAYREALTRLTSPFGFRENPFDFFADRLLPAQQYVPELTDTDFAGVARTFNESRIGVVFNSYDPKQGTGSLYGNDAARALLPAEKALPNTHAAQLQTSPHPHDMRYVSDVTSEKEILPITAEAVRSALWLSLYGFQNMPSGRMDGAYTAPASCPNCTCSTASLSRGRLPMAGATGRRPTGSRCRTGTPRCGSRSATRRRSQASGASTT